MTPQTIAAKRPEPAQTARAIVKPMANRPNILYIIMEDVGPQFACYGEPLVSTPHLDRLAGEGTRFTQVFSAAPVCSASRSCLMTGNFQTRIGAHQHRTWPWRKQALQTPVRHISDWFRDAGYFTCNLQPGDRVGGEQKAGLHGAAGSGKIDLNFFRNDAKKQNFFDGNDWNQRAQEQPFFAHITIIETHKGAGWKVARQQPKDQLVDPAAVKLASFYPDNLVARDEYANYLDAIHLSDGYVGELLARLERDGLAKNTVVVLSSDHGQCLFRSKQFLYDGGLHIPLIVRYPDGKGAGTVDDRFISGVDVAPMLLGMAGIEVPRGAMQGHDPLAPDAKQRDYILAARDRMDIAMDRMRAVRTRKYKYIRNYQPAVPYMQKNPYKEEEYPTWNLVKELAKENKLTLTQGLFAASDKPVEELFDLSADPDEVHNLATDIAFESTLRELRSVIDQFVQENDGPVVNEDSLEVYRGFYGHLPEQKSANVGE
jgi:arylsulfatase A-like enzyme